MELNTDMLLNIALRSGTVFLLVLLSAALLRAYSSLAARLGATFAIGVAAFAVSSTANFSDHPIRWHIPVAALSTGNAIVLWLFACALFNDAFKLKVWHWLVWSLLAVAGAANCFIFIPAGALIAEFIGALSTVSVVVFAAMALGYAFMTWRNDLVEGRRRMRVIFVGVIAAYTVAMSSTAMISGRDAEAVLASTANAWGLAILSAIFTWQMMRASNNELFAVMAPHANPGGALNLKATATESKTTFDPKLLASIEQLMSVERVYREENLTVGTLAQKMGIPEHALRKLINQHLGHRNFTAFLNGYRLTEAKAALLDPEKAHLPILTIALSTGFQSIGPFNRAFKAETGATPSDFRRAATESLRFRNT